MKPKLLDLFCGAGGCSMGYSRAGFDVVGVDLHPQKRYPFEFHQGDALEYLSAHGHEFDVIHASPPCQKYSRMNRMPNARKDHPDLIEPTRKLLKKIGKPSVMENVDGAPLARGSIMLCGTMFGLGVAAALAELRRHRWFECSFALLAPECRHFAPLCIGVNGDHGNGPNSRDKMKRMIVNGEIPARPVQVVGCVNNKGARERMEKRAIQVVGVYGNQGYHPNQAPRRPRCEGVWGNAGRVSIRDGVQQFTTAERAEAMGIDWMTGKELSQAIPPAYTEFIGERLMAILEISNNSQNSI